MSNTQHLGSSTDLFLIQKSLQLLDNEKSERLISLSYALFFEACPDAQSLWEKDDPVSRLKMFNGVILSLIDKLSRPQIYQTNLRQDIKDHQNYGVKGEMYVLFFKALRDALAQVLADDFNDEMQRAWGEQLEQMLKTIEEVSG